MRLPEADGWEVEISVLARLEKPGARHGHSDSCGTARESLNESLATTRSKVVVRHPKEASSTVKGPQDHDRVEVLDLREALGSKVVIQADDGSDSQADVQDLEDLVKGVPENAGRLNCNDDKRSGCLEETLATVLRILFIKMQCLHTTNP